jgi:hypothetical protein
MMVLFSHWSFLFRQAWSAWSARCVGCARIMRAWRRSWRGRGRALRGTARWSVSWRSSGGRLPRWRTPGTGSASHYTLQRKSHLCIPFLGIARRQSQFPHSCVCERFIYSQDRYTWLQHIKRPILEKYKSLTDI